MMFSLITCPCTDLTESHLKLLPTCPVAPNPILVLCLNFAPKHEPESVSRRCPSLFFSKEMDLAKGQTREKEAGSTIILPAIMTQW
jgi:hypothetical protein